MHGRRVTFAFLQLVVHDLHKYNEPVVYILVMIYNVTVSLRGNLRQQHTAGTDQLLCKLLHVILLDR